MTVLSTSRQALAQPPARSTPEPFRPAHRRLGTLAVGAWLALAPCAMAQQPAPAPATAASGPATACDPAIDLANLPPQRLYGLWRFVWWPEGGDPARPTSRGAVLLERHPEFPGSVRGTLRRETGGNDATGLVSGDVADGEFNLDESADGLNLDAAWTGEVFDCGLTLQGVRRPVAGRLPGEPLLNFRLEKVPGWR